MPTEQQARQLAAHWIDAWNSHDLAAILSHYAEGVELVSPVAARLLADPSGTVRGKQALRAYFSRGLEAFPELRFRLLDVMWGLSSVVLCYENQGGTRTGEFMELDADGKVVRVVANYNGQGEAVASLLAARTP
jgi:predicted ester cyclase